MNRRNKWLRNSQEMTVRYLSIISKYKFYRITDELMLNIYFLPGAMPGDVVMYRETIYKKPYEE